jgi:lysophospholipase L1-like esterase
MVKPFRIFILLLVLLLLLSIPGLLFPPDGIRIGSLTLRYPGVRDIFALDDSADRDAILTPEVAFLGKLIDSTELAAHAPDTPEQHREDTIPASDSTSLPNTAKPKDFNPEWVKSRLVRIEFPDSTRSSLDRFFESLRSGEPSKRMVRVLHYGDSQIEGDRITSFLRSRLQARFGGCGPGILQAVPHSYQPGSIRQWASSNWEKFSVTDRDKKDRDVTLYGALGGYSTFSGSYQLLPRGNVSEAWVRVQRTGPRANPSRNFNRVRILYGYNNAPLIIELKASNNLLDADMIPASGRLSQSCWSIPASLSPFEITFRGDDSPFVFGISLESDNGVLVDNIPLRGSSGTEFARFNQQFLKEILALLNTKLIILQFGVNAIPNVVKSYRYYENQLYNQIRILQDAKPDASIVMIGVSDMSRKEGMQYVSYPNVECIRDAQRNAAFRAGVPFWDCYKAMGGHNSMVAWVFATPALAAKDFTHFSTRGAKIIAEMFYSALMAEYDSYLQSFGQSTAYGDKNQPGAEKTGTQAGQNL